MGFFKEAMQIGVLGKKTPTRKATEENPKQINQNTEKIITMFNFSCTFLPFKFSRASVSQAKPHIIQGKQKINSEKVYVPG